MTDWKAATKAAAKAISDHDGDMPIALAHEFLQAALDALKAAGYVYVPTDPTLGMVYAAVDAGGGKRKLYDHQARDAWHAMIKAAQADME
jgi:hypothetical protein